MPPWGFAGRAVVGRPTYNLAIPRAYVPPQATFAAPSRPRPHFGRHGGGRRANFSAAEHLRRFGGGRCPIYYFSWWKAAAAPIAAAVLWRFRLQRDGQAHDGGGYRVHPHGDFAA